MSQTMMLTFNYGVPSKIKDLRVWEDKQCGGGDLLFTLSLAIETFTLDYNITMATARKSAKVAEGSRDSLD